MRRRGIGEAGDASDASDAQSMWQCASTQTGAEADDLARVEPNGAMDKRAAKGAIEVHDRVISTIQLGVMKRRGSFAD